jgi:replicative DNA helicase
MTQALENARVRHLQTVGGRVPPHDLDAEESLLGAMLLSRDAIAAALECCGAEDFYKPAHAHIFAAVCALYTRGEPADPVTVADELRRTGVLEAIGEPSVLLSLQVNTPSTANASHYARIVEEHALLRKLVGVAGEIAELGYSVPEDVSEAVDRAEAMVFEVAQRRVVDTMSPLRELLAQSLDHLEALVERGETITGVPSGYADLDERLAGLQKSNLVVVGARPSMGKALALETPVATPAGWTTMGELRVGDHVFDEKGQPCAVDYVSPVLLGHRCYLVCFDDGSEIVADAGHRWFAYDLSAWRSRLNRSARMELAPPADPGLATDQSERWRLPRVVTTEQMLAEGARRADGRPNWYVQLAGALEAPASDLPVDPYVLGWWLGSETTTSPESTTGPADVQHFVTEFEHRGYSLTEYAGFRSATTAVRQNEGCQDHQGPHRALARELEKVGLLVSTPKRIPDRYLRASFKQRLELLQGILDNVGTVTNGSAELCLSNRILLEQVRELVCSLGHKPLPIKVRKARLASGETAESWRFRWVPLDPVFRLSRKACRLAASASNWSSSTPIGRAVVAIEDVRSVPMRCIAVGSRSHLFLAGRSMIPTHNTSFALGVLNHAAVHARVPVLMFSLEMSHLELTQRMLCSEARVDAIRMRNGRLLESDWPKISAAIGRLGDAPIYLDDNPNVTIMDIRAKARRLKAREGLGLVVVDYLQLMTGHTRSRAENRQVEVSEISRGLKVLARELDIPVIALSQLSRNLEMRQDKRPVLADLRESGCLTGDTRITRADTGAEVTIEELMRTGERNIPVWALDQRLCLVKATMSHAFASGTKRVFEMRLASGRRVKASANHKFRTVQGWRCLGELAVGDRLAIPRAISRPTTNIRWPEAEIVMLAHLIGDGCFVEHQPVHYTSADEANLRSVENAALHFGITPRRVAQGRWSHVYLPSPYSSARGRLNPINNWLGELELRGLRSYEKFVPRAVFGLPDDQVALFLRHLWATGGCLSMGRDGRQVRCYYGSSSRRLAEDVQALLLRFGIAGRVKSSVTGAYRPMHQVHIHGAADQLRFLRAVGIAGSRGEAVPAAVAYLSTVVANTNFDTVPSAIWANVKARMSKVGMTHRAMSTAMGRQCAGDSRYRYSPSRDGVTRLADLPTDDTLTDLAVSDVFWDEIVSVEEKCDEPVYDATVFEHHNFLANGIVAHNSIEQDADVVLFIYRDEIYNPDSQDRGTAEILIAKHRNGPTGVVQLAFVDHHTRFANIARV